MCINHIRHSTILLMILLGLFTTTLTGCGSSGDRASETTSTTWDDMKWDEGEWQ